MVTRIDHARYPWEDVRLWAFPLLVAGLAGLADAGWVALFPGRGLGVLAAALGAAAVGLGATATALHPRSARWTSEGHVLPVLWPVVVAFALVRPVAGPGFWAFAWSCALLLYVWAKTRAFVRSAIRRTIPGPFGGPAQMAPPADGEVSGAVFAAEVGRATTDVLWGVGTWLALCALGAGGAGHGRDRLFFLGLAAAGGSLALGAWTARAEVLAAAAGTGAAVQPGFARLWWWAAVPVVCACLVAGAVFPTYPAPLQHGTLAQGVVRVADFWTARMNAGSAAGAGASVRRAPVNGGARTVLVLALLLVAAFAWPLRRWTRRWLTRAGVPDAPGGDVQESILLRDRIAQWWRACRHWWARLWRRPVLGAPPRWRPQRVSPPPAPPPARSWGPEADVDDLRGRVRAAYARLLLAAAGFGLARATGHSPRAYHAWLQRQVRAADAPLAELTGAYEEARFSRHPVEAGAVEAAEANARAVAYALDAATRSHRRGARQDEGLRWTAPRGFGRGKSAR